MFSKTIIFTSIVGWQKNKVELRASSAFEAIPCGSSAVINNTTLFLLRYLSVLTPSARRDTKKWRFSLLLVCGKFSSVDQHPLGSNVPRE